MIDEHDKKAPTRIPNKKKKALTESQARKKKTKEEDMANLADNRKATVTRTLKKKATAL
jgi:hypothetical protein